MRFQPRYAFCGSVASCMALFACSSSSTPSSPNDAGTDHRATDATTLDAADVDAGAEASAGPWPTPPAWNAKVTRPASAAAAASARQACQFKRGDLPAKSLDPAFPLGDANPIQNIVVLMQENRSFDTYFAHLNAYAHRTDIDSAPDAATNPNAMNEPQPFIHAPGGLSLPGLCFADTDHSWHGAHVEWNDGGNNGFYIQNNGTMLNDAGVNLMTGDRSLWWYDQSDLPFYYDLYSTFAISDAYYSALLGPTYPNRDYLYAGTSFGETTNDFPPLTGGQLTVPSNLVIFDELAQRNIAFNIFTESSAGVGTVLSIGYLSRWSPLKPISTLTEFFARAKAGTLPPVSFLDHNFEGEGPDGDDEHPPAQIQVGQAATWQIVQAIMTSPQWPHIALFISYDENGGEYDHVSPPPACVPDDIAPILTGSDVGTPGTFNQYGFRVPFVVVSPYAKKAYVSHNIYSHTSIIRFIEAKFTLPALTGRDANSDAFSDLFDWSNPPFMTPPTFTQPTVNMGELTQCETLYKAAP
jgi:phospholipase C